MFKCQKLVKANIQSVTDYCKLSFNFDKTKICIEIVLRNCGKYSSLFIYKYFGILFLVLFKNLDVKYFLDS